MIVLRCQFYSHCLILNELRSFIHKTIDAKYSIKQNYKALFLSNQFPIRNENTGGGGGGSRIRGEMTEPTISLDDRIYFARHL